MQFEDISLRSRRLAQRNAVALLANIKIGTIFPTTLQGIICELSSNGFLFLSHQRPKYGSKAVLTTELLDELIKVRCVRSDSSKKGGSWRSAWVATTHKQTLLLKQLLEHLKASPQADRRSLEQSHPRHVRTEDSISQNSLLEPDSYPIYRRSGTERRQGDRRLQRNLTTNDKRLLADRRHQERRNSRPTFTPDKSDFEQNIYSLTTMLRDMLIPYMPKPVVRLLVGKGEFVFIAHPRDINDVIRMFPVVKWLPESLVKKWLMGQKPLIGSKIKGLKDREGKDVNGWFLIAPRLTVQMMRNNDAARRCISDAVKLAEKIGAKIAGLGAFTSIVTHDGRDLIDQATTGLTTGNPLSAAIAVQNAVKAASLVGLDLDQATIAIVGAGGSVGSGCARSLAKKGKQLILIDINRYALNALKDSIKSPKAELVLAHNLEKVLSADVVIVATNTPGAIIHAQHLKSGAIVIDCAQPKNVSDEVPKKRNDVIVIESAIVETPSVDVHFDLDLNRHEALGCLAETMVLTSLHWPGTYAIGKSQDHQVSEIYAAAKQTGFRLAYFRNASGYIDENLLNRARKIIKGA